MSRYVFLVIALDYDSQPVVCGFHRQADAEAFAALCNTYEQCPDAPPFDAADAECERWERKRARWAKRHPAGERFADYNDFRVAQVEIRAAAIRTAMGEGSGD